MIKVNSMRMGKKSVFYLSGWLVLTLIPIMTANSFDASQYYEMKCASCHTIGGGEDVGPDLKGVTKRREKKWLTRFIQESQTMVNEGDPLAVELFEKYKRKKMPDQELSDAQVETLLAFIETGKASGSTQTFKSALKASPYEIEQGRLLFSGQKAFEKGGASCISCHSAGEAGYLGGGMLGPDLTLSYSNYNDKGLSKVLTRVSFPSMMEIYKKHPLTKDEVYQLKSYLYTVDKKGKTMTGATKKFAFMGVVGFLIVLGGFDLLWRTRRHSKRRK